MLTRARHLLVGVALLIAPASTLVCQQLKPAALPAPIVTPAKDGIFIAFQTHSVVALGDVHGIAQEEDFFTELIRDPRFAREVGNVVVEFGDAAEQETIDRYDNGEDVPYQQLRRVWADTAGWLPTVTALGYLNFFAEVRRVNLTLPPTQRIRIWLGDPPIDWSKVITRADLEKVADRDQYPAELIESHVLAKNLKTLVIYGVGHLSGEGSLAALVEKAHPGAFFGITPYSGFVQKSCSAAFENMVAAWPSSALATPVRNSTLERELRHPGCQFVDPSEFHFKDAASEAEKTEVIKKAEDKRSGIRGDALLYLGPAASLTRSPLTPDLYLDEDFRKEIGRRFEIRTGLPLYWPSAADNPMSAVFLHRYDQPVVGAK